jgi:uncharacterized repeat protein (TIGR03803 family)
MTRYPAKAYSTIRHLKRRLMTRTGQHWRCISAIPWLGAMLVFALIGTPSALAQTYTYQVLHSFTRADGALPEAGLIRDSVGNLYGTTYYGGASNGGVVFKVDTAGTETVLHSFTGGADGRYPEAGLIADSAGNLYGTNQNGGPSNAGVVFKLNKTGLTVLHSFTGGADGGTPFAGLIADSAGNLYGTTALGGSGFGVVFKLDTSDTETVLHSFTGGADGNGPRGLIRGPAGNLFGTTTGGGTPNRGVVFKLDTSGTETVLHTFRGPDGRAPVAGLIGDSAGNLYGTTALGGASNWGVVFKVDTTGRETVLYSFTGGADGGQPYAGLIRDAAGNLYGTTRYGGVTFGVCAQTNPCGVVFKLDALGTETVLYSFTGGADGGQPYAGLIRDAAGNLYGTTLYGGTSGEGVVFKLTPASN